MNHANIIAHLRVNAEIFKLLFQGLTVEQARWKPDKDRWSLLEVINHLYDEERQDFRQRLALTLFKPEKDWPPIDPEGWLTQRGYNERNPTQCLQDLQTERQQSLDWLESLNNPDWQATHTHRPVGTLSAEQILANWLAHDLFHIRQANDLHFAWLNRLVSPVSLRYSGWEVSQPEE
jgi:hypothetical protein